jgi:minor extracellular serine protease Vpr
LSIGEVDFKSIDSLTWPTLSDITNLMIKVELFSVLLLRERTMLLGRTLLTLLVITLLGCSDGRQNQLYRGQGDIGTIRNFDIISDRSLSDDDSREDYSYMVILRFRQLPLLEAATYDQSGAIVISPLQRQRLMAEQKYQEEALAAISSKIRVIYRYRFVLNGFAVAVPPQYFEQVFELQGVKSAQVASEFDPPKLAISNLPPIFDIFTDIDKRYDLATTSSSFIGATQANSELGINGKGVKVGIIDSGIDYTHSMLGGDGDLATYQGVDPNLADQRLFPNHKVVGGMDFVGSLYAPSGKSDKSRIPVPDNNPIDESGHGTHVAGSVAGRGDGVKSYDGVAPEAMLYALKVFGQGGTSDSAVIAALEYAVDPNQDMDTSDHLDVVNLSLGGNFGKPYVMYNQAISNAIRGGISVVAAAGNSGEIPYVVGAPSTVEDSISVAASIDGMAHNWQFPAVEFFITPDTNGVVAEFVESTFSKPIRELSDSFVGELFYVGIAAADFTEEEAELIKGKIALIDRGEVSFVDKVQRVQQAGAIGAVVVNSKPDEIFTMSGEGKVDIPAIMIKKGVGDIIKAGATSLPVTVDFRTKRKFEKREAIDTIAGFSSQGPRMQDSLIKPEISAPGQQIISALSGMGSEVVAQNGTSMASPHIAGAIALLKHRYPSLNPVQLKSLLMSSSLRLRDTSNSGFYSISRQGAGRVDIMAALKRSLMVVPAMISLGEFGIIGGKRIRRKLNLTNLTSSEEQFNLLPNIPVKFRSLVSLAFSPSVVKLAAGESQTVEVLIELRADSSPLAISSVEGWIDIRNAAGEHQAQLPLMGIMRKLSRIEASKATVYAATSLESEGADVELPITNHSSHRGVVLPFNYLGGDELFPRDPFWDRVYSRMCDLESVGHRIVNRDGREYMQFGIKVHAPLGRWQACQISIQLDSDGDGVAEQELVGIHDWDLQGLRGQIPAGNNSLLLDAAAVRAIRADHQKLQAEAKEGESVAPLNYFTALVEQTEMVTFNHSTVAVVMAPLDRLVKGKVDGNLHVKISVLNEDTMTIVSDDYLGEGDDGDKIEWKIIPTSSRQQSFQQLPEQMVLEAYESTIFNLVKGVGSRDIILYLPNNAPVNIENTLFDQQSKVISPVFLYQGPTN